MRTAKLIGKLIFYVFSTVLILTNIYSILWTGGVIHPKDVNTYYYIKQNTIVPNIYVYKDGIKIGDYYLRVYSYNNDTKIKVYINKISLNKSFTISTDRYSKVRFEMCGLGKGEYSVYLDGNYTDTVYDGCVDIVRDLTPLNNHTINIYFVSGNISKIHKSNNIININKEYIIDGALALGILILLILLIK